MNNIFRMRWLLKKSAYVFVIVLSVYSTYYSCICRFDKCRSCRFLAEKTNDSVDDNNKHLEDVQKTQNKKYQRFVVCINVSQPPIAKPNHTYSSTQKSAAKKYMEPKEPKVLYFIALYASLLGPRWLSG